jgi:hypothetical protein
MSSSLVWSRTPKACVRTLALEKSALHCEWIVIAEIPMFPINQDFPSWPNSPSGPGPPHYRGFTVTIRRTTPGKTVLSITNKMQRYTIFFIPVNALHVSGGFSAHHQELKLYIQHLVYVKLVCCYR